MFPGRIGPLDGDGGGLDILQLKSRIRVELVGCTRNRTERERERDKSSDCQEEEYLRGGAHRFALAKAVHMLVVPACHSYALPMQLV